MPEFPIPSARILLVSQIQGGQLPSLPPCPVLLCGYSVKFRLSLGKDYDFTVHCIRSCILSADNRYVFWSACVLPLCVVVCANVVVITRLLVSYCRARCKHQPISDKPTQLNAAAHRVRDHLPKTTLLFIIHGSRIPDFSVVKFVKIREFYI